MSTPRDPLGRAVVWLSPLWMVLVALVAAGLTGALAPLGVVGLPDPGALTRVGLPVVQAVRDLATALAVGALVVAATCVAPARSTEEARVSGARRRLLALAQISATTWAVTSALLVGLVFSDASGSAVSSAGFFEQAAYFATQYEIGQYVLWGAGIATVVAVGAALVSRMGGVGVLAVLALIGLWPIALTGHAAGTLLHDEAVNLQLFHLVGISVWMGGLVALVSVRGWLGDGLAAAVGRYSTLAGWSFAAVALSGLAGVWLRLPGIDGLWSSYGVLVGAKVVLLVALGGAGWWQRRSVLGRLRSGDQRALWRLVSVEVLLLLTASGLGVALSRTAPPAPEGPAVPLTAAESLLGRALPGPLDAAGWFTSFDVDVLFLPVAVLGIVWYVLAVRRLRRQGDAWPWLRTASWVLGWLLFAWATNGAPALYGRVLFSMHMVQHMTIATAVPLFLVIGTPVTLALRTLKRRDDGSRGPREWLLRVVRSVPVAVLGHPIVAGGLFVVSMVVFYYSSLFELSLESHTAHILMTVHFLLSGYLFAECIIGADPGARRPSYPMRALMVMITFGFHALFAVSLMASTTILAEDWYSLLGRTWGRTLEEDQLLGAQLGWALGEYPIVIIAFALVVSWVRADQRERRRFDRSEDREQDRQLTAYNERLRRLADGEAGIRRPPPTMEPRRTVDDQESTPR